FFIIYFVCASVITTVFQSLIASGTITGASAEMITGFFSFMKKVSKFFIVMAMAAIGINTDIVKLVKTGTKPLFLGCCCWVGITSVSLIMQHILGIW
ncbi:MAG: putative sulfate exporter family transporter, partial [Firmicutes bacterium]|nr:putative sulfate exporter family transporter [Bacillota bacterium]